MREIAADADALVEGLERGARRARLLVVERRMWPWTKSQIACTRPQPGGVSPNRSQAAWLSRSVSQ